MYYEGAFGSWSGSISKWPASCLIMHYCYDHSGPTPLPLDVGVPRCSSKRISPSLLDWLCCRARLINPHPTAANSGDPRGMLAYIDTLIAMLLKVEV